jgi:hypothetical protein
VGKSEVNEKSAMLALRYNGTKEPWSGDVASFGAFVAAKLDAIQNAMLAKATEERNAKLKVVRCWCVATTLLLSSVYTHAYLR